MNTPSLLVAALVVLPAIAVVLFTWRAMRRTERALRLEAGLQTRDFEIGNWPTPGRAALP